MTNPPARPFSLRDLPGPTRCVLGVFLVAIGFGYFAGLVQLHHQHAPPGSLMPGPDDAVRIYNGGPKGDGKSKLLHLIEADEKLPFNGTGTMKPAFTTKSERRWDATVARLMPAELQKLLEQREGERQAMIDWLKKGANKTAYEKDEFELTVPLVLSDDFIVGEKNEKGQATKVLIAGIIRERCVRCHAEGGADKNAAKFRLDDWNKLQPHTKPIEAPGPMDIKKLAQTTHVHLIGFTMMFCLTGVIFSLTSWPVWVRTVLAPWPMFFQVIDIGCWWLGRLDPMAAQAILVTGGLVGAGFGLQILGGLLDLMGLVGRRKM